MLEKNQLNRNVISATKWSFITQIIGKLVVPVTNMILARILVPEIFGVIATINMVVSFADMFTDAGFQKYIVQHEFSSEDEKNRYITVAFWTNLFVSIMLWALISIFSKRLSALVGSPGLGNVLIIASLSLPLTSFSSIQMSIFKRDLDYKTLFFMRIISILIPFVITIPLALLSFSYWSLVIATLFANLVNAILLTVKSKWKPNLYYSFDVLKQMLSFSLWSLAEAVAIWAISWSGTFIVGLNLNQYYIGLYKTSISTVNGITGIVTDSTTSVLFSTLSRLQNNKVKFEASFLKFQRLAAYLLFPMSIGIFIYRDLVTSILLGSKWAEASLFVGIWGLSSSISIVFGQYCGEVYRALGKPKISLLAQILHLVVLVPVLIITSKESFTVLIYSRSLLRVQYIIVNVLLMNYFIKIGIIKMIKNIIPSIVGSVIMGCIAIILSNIEKGIVWDFISIILCIFIYAITILIFPSVREEAEYLINSIKKKPKIEC
ncbi:lipopolysaccharide biosynthesis protein [Clostridium isatidis]|uniref:lipopolysaccharide biosynthesis protein n=1 Tax=Clostridium isatidis TaxID=182773 RepID=UPI003AAFD58C